VRINRLGLLLTTVGVFSEVHLMHCIYSILIIVWHIIASYSSTNCTQKLITACYAVTVLTFLYRM